MIFEIYHRNRPTFFNNDLEILSTFPKHFTRVATINAFNHEHAFELSQSIHHDWSQNSGVLQYHGPYRSTSVGDVIAQENGLRFSCDMMGWTKF
jgi:hypothetical protein